MYFSNITFKMAMSLRQTYQSITKEISTLSRFRLHSQYIVSNQVWIWQAICCMTLSSGSFKKTYSHRLQIQDKRYLEDYYKMCLCSSVKPMLEKVLSEQKHCPRSSHDKKLIKSQRLQRDDPCSVYRQITMCTSCLAHSSACCEF